MPVVDYCDIIWMSNSTIVSKLDNKCGRWLKLILGRGYNPQLSLHLMPSLRNRLHTATQTYKILHQLCPPYLKNLVQFARDVTSRSDRRNNHRVYVPQIRTTYAKNSYYFRCTSLWNCLAYFQFTYFNSPISPNSIIFKKLFHVHQFPWLFVVVVFFWRGEGFWFLIVLFCFYCYCIIISGHCWKSAFSWAVHL